MNGYDVIVIGGGQSGLAAAYYLNRTKLSYVVLDRETSAGGSWQHYWRSLRLFSPAQWSSLPGVLMKGGGAYYPSRDETIEYLNQYEHRYKFPIKRPVEVKQVITNGDGFLLYTSDGEYRAKVVVSATGSFRSPFVPAVPGLDQFKGKVMHSADYMSPEDLAGKKVAIVGEGNSGAQILAEVSKVADTIWITKKPPRFLPDHVDGRYLFDAATQMYEAKKSGKPFTPPSLGDIVMVDSVKEARERNVLKSVGAIDYVSDHAVLLTNGDSHEIDAIVFCTGFKNSLNHLESLGIVNDDSRIDTIDSRAIAVEGLWLLGYGNWTGFASATLIGVGRSARQAVEEIIDYVQRTTA